MSLIFSGVNVKIFFSPWSMIAIVKISSTLLKAPHGASTKILRAVVYDALRTPHIIKNINADVYVLLLQTWHGKWVFEGWNIFDRLERYRI